MNKYSGVIFNKNREILHILQDNLSIFSQKGVAELPEIFTKDSRDTLSQFFTHLSEIGLVMDWSIEILQDSRSQKVYLSGILWMDFFLVCIAADEGICGFLSLKKNHIEITRKQEYDQDELEHIEELNEISRLNNELVEIQRELTKKNLNLELLNRRLEELATTDPLTGIFNRRAVFERVRMGLSRALRENQSCGLAILDLDKFKKINDQFGHLMGDDALVIASKCLKQSTREYDIAGRIGGDEFLVYFAVETKAQFEAILQRLLTNINTDTMDISGELTIRVKASIGGVFVNAEKEQGEIGINLLIKKADDALYKAKDRGGNTVVIHEL